MRQSVSQHANKLYFERELKLNECLRLVLADQVPIRIIVIILILLTLFLFQIEAVDFKGKPEEARVGMNNWVEGLTKGNIK